MSLFSLVFADYIIKEDTLTILSKYFKELYSSLPILVNESSEEMVKLMLLEKCPRFKKGGVITL